MSVLTFQVGAERCGLELRHVAEVVPRVRLQPVAGAPRHVAGVFVHRGRPVPVVDLHRLFGAGECPPHLSSRIILVPFGPAGEHGHIGLLAARVADIVEVNGADASAGDRFVADGAGLLRVLDPGRLLESVGGTAALLGGRL